jgi:hypothetical protein
MVADADSVPREPEILIGMIVELRDEAMEGVAVARGCHCGLMRQTRRGARAGRGTMTLDQLNSWLRTLEPPAQVDGMSMLDGYLTAIIVGPCSIPPDEWFIDLLDEHGRIAMAAGKALVAIKAIAGGSTRLVRGSRSRLKKTLRSLSGRPTGWCCLSPGAWGS